MFKIKQGDAWVIVPGTKGRDGDEHVYVGPIAPENKSLIWIQTTDTRDSGIRKFDINTGTWVLIPGTIGAGVESALVNPEGNLIITISHPDGTETTIDAGNVKGVPGAEIQLRNNGTAIQWKYDYELIWKDLVPLTDITGKTAYQAAVEGGYTGTEAEFNEVLSNSGEVPYLIEVPYLEDGNAFLAYKNNKVTLEAILRLYGEGKRPDFMIDLTQSWGSNIASTLSTITDFSINESGSGSATIMTSYVGATTSELNCKGLRLDISFSTTPEYTVTSCITNWWSAPRYTGVYNGLDSNSTTLALTANQGNILNNKFNSYLPLAGGTMTGNIDLSTHSILAGSSGLVFATTTDGFKISSESGKTYIQGSELYHSVGDLNYTIYDSNNLTDTIVNNKLLTGLTTGTSKDITAADSIVGAFGKLLFWLSQFYTKEEIDNIMSGLFKYIGSKQTYEELPSENNRVGDVYTVIEAYQNYPPGSEFVWDGTTWEYFGGNFQLTKESIEEVLTGNITSHTHSYLPLTGGTVTGDMTVTGSNFYLGPDPLTTDFSPTLFFSSTNNASGNYITSQASTNSPTTNGLHYYATRHIFFGSGGVLRQSGAGIIPLYDETNFVAGTNYITPDGLNIALADYLPLSGGTMTGKTYYPNINAGWEAINNNEGGLLNVLGTPASEAFYPILKTMSIDSAGVVFGRFNNTVGFFHRIASEAPGAYTSRLVCDVTTGNWIADKSIQATTFIGNLTGTASMASSLDPTKTYTAVNFSTSDKRLKTDIKLIDKSTVDKAVDAVRLNRDFVYKDSGVRGYSPIAQELEEILPDLVNTNDSGIKGINEISLLHLQVQGLLEKITKLESQIDELKSRCIDE